MALTEEDKRDHAARILGEVVQNLEYSFVYEDERLAGTTEEEQRAIHDLMNSAQVFVTWPGVRDEYQVAGPEEEEEV